MGLPANIKIIKNPHKDDLDDLVADLSDDIREKFLVSLSDDENRAVIDSGYTSVSQIIPFSSLLSLSQIKSFKVG